MSELVSTTSLSMDRFRLEDDEFSDLSDSDDSSIKEVRGGAVMIVTYAVTYTVMIAV